MLMHGLLTSDLNKSDGEKEVHNCLIYTASSTNEDTPVTITRANIIEEEDLSADMTRSSPRSLKRKATKWIASHVPRRTHHRRRSFTRKTSLLVTQYDEQFNGTYQLTLEDLIEARSKSSRAYLNVGGQRHEILWKSLSQYPNSRLGRLSRSMNPMEVMYLCDDYVPEKNEFYFDHSARSFGSILDLYRTGHLHILEEVCVMAFSEDLKYWGLSECLLDACCLTRYFQRKDRLEEDVKKTSTAGVPGTDEEQFSQGKCGELQRTVWDTVEKPQTSTMARIFATISIGFVMISIVGLNLSTIPGIGEIEGNYSGYSGGGDIRWRRNYHLETLEMVCTIWFTFEYLIRFATAPNKCQFLKSFLNLIDLVATLPYYVTKILEAFFESLGAVGEVVQVLQILRVFRVFKLARHSSSLQALGHTLTQSYQELGVLVFFVVLIVLLFSTFAYFAERHGNRESFNSIPATFWWATITITTVGYGDVTPKSPLGKFIGCLCSICGVLVIALPIPIIVNNFAEYYQDQARLKKAARRREQMEKALELVKETDGSGLHDVENPHAMFTEGQSTITVVNKLQQDHNGTASTRLSLPTPKSFSTHSISEEEDDVAHEVDQDKA